MTTTLWTFETAHLRVSWQIEPDMDLDLSWDDSGEVADKIDSGEYTAFQSRISVTHKDTGAVLGETFLGGSVYADPEDFRDHLGSNAGRWGSYFSDMVREACKQARETLRVMQSIPVRSQA